MERVGAVNTSYTGTASAVEILPSDPNRKYLCLYAVTGTCQIAFGIDSGDFNDNAITIEQGVMWEPRVIITSSILFKGDGAILTVLA